MRPLLISLVLLVSGGITAQQAGDLDPTFGTSGIVTTDFLSSIDGANDAVLQPDGMIVIVGTTSATPAGPDKHFLLARVKPDGSRDSTFGLNGLVKTSIGGGYAEARGVALQQDGKIVAAGISLGLFYGDLTVARYHPNGMLDSSFNGTGIATLELWQVEEAQDIAIQPDGKIVVLGSHKNPTLSADDFLLVRYNPDGTLDTTFNHTGIVFKDFGTNMDWGYTLALQPNGKIIVAGGAYASAISAKFALARYNPNGSIDLTFNGTGHVVTAIGNVASIQSLAIQADGKILAGGYTMEANSFDLATARYQVNGQLDSGFGDSGVVITAVGSGYDAGHDLAIQADNKIVVAGRTSAGGSNDNFAVVRYNPDGTLDNGFGSFGKRTTAFGPDVDGAYAVLLQNDQKIVVVGWARMHTKRDEVALARYMPHGNLDPGFHGDGLATFGVGSSDGGFAIGIKPNTDIVVGGTSDKDFAVARYKISGALDAAFSSDGKVTSDIATGDDRIQSLALSIDDKITVAGRSQSGTQSTFALARYNTFGTLDNSFSGDGQLTTDVDSLSQAHAVALQTNGRIVAGGFSFNGANTDFAVTRYSSTGVPDNSFDADGIVVTDYINLANSGYAMALQPDGKIVLAGTTRGDMAVVRYNTNGSVDPGFGIVSANIGGADTAFAVVVQPDGKIVVAGCSDAAFAVARFKGNGERDSTFGTDGHVITPVGTRTVAKGVVLQPDGKIVVAGTSDRRFAAARYKTDGTLDSSFSSDGIAVVPVGDWAYGHGLTLQADGKIVIAGGSEDDFAMIRLFGSSCTPAFNSISATACTQYVSPSGQHIWTTSGTYVDTLWRPNGCDSLITIHLTVVRPDTVVAVNGFTLTASGASTSYQWLDCGTGTAIPGATMQHFTVTDTGYYAVIVSIGSCKDTSACRFVAGPCYRTASIHASACDAYTSPSGHYVWTTSGTYHDTLTTVGGCDSFMVIHLAINQTHTTVNASACFSYISPSGLYEWTMSGIYHDTLTNSHGCDSIVSVNLNVYGPDLTVTQSGNTLTSAATGATYKWIDCTTGLDVPGATAQSFTPSVSGSYAVIVVKDGCRDTSDCTPVVVGLDDVVFTPAAVYPNPTSGELVVDFGSVQERVVVELADVTGRLIQHGASHGASRLTLSVEGSVGMYVLTVRTADSVRTYRVIKH